MFDDPTTPKKPLSVWDAAERAERDFGIPTGLLRGLGMEESHGLNQYDERGNVIASPTGPRGAFQFTRKTARQYNIDRDDPMENIVGAAAYLKDNYKELRPLLDDDTEAWTASAIAHNRGLGAVRGMIKNRRFEPSGVDSGNGGDTRAYTTRILRNWSKLRDGKPFDPSETSASSAAGFYPTMPAQVGEPLPDQFVDQQDIAAGLKAPVTVPESPATLDAQRLSAQLPSSPRVGTLFTPGEQIPQLGQDETDVPLADGRVLRANTAKLQNYLATNPVTMADIYSGKVPVADLIGKVANVGNDTAEGPAVLTTDQRGTELSASIAPTPEDAQKQAAVDQAAFPGSRSQVVPARVVAESRMQALNEFARAQGLPAEDMPGYAPGIKDAPIYGAAPADPLRAEYEDFLKQTGLPDSQASRDEFDLAQRASAEGADAQNRRDAVANVAGAQASRQPTAARHQRPDYMDRVQDLPTQWKASSHLLTDDDLLKTAKEFQVNLDGVPDAEKTAFASMAAAVRIGHQYGLSAEDIDKFAKAGFAEGNVRKGAKSVTINVPRSVIARYAGVDKVRAEYDAERAEPTLSTLR